jgi:hypothetical protein
LWRDSVFAVPKPSFGAPVPAPIADPLTGGGNNYHIACDWLPVVRGALLQLVLQATWQTDVIPLDITQGRAMSLIASLTECEGAEVPFACPYDFTTSPDGLPWADHTRGDLTEPHSHFVASVGFNSVSSFEPGGGQYWQCVTIALPLPDATAIDLVQVALTGVTPGSNYSGLLHANPSGIFLFDGLSVIASNTRPSDENPPGDSTFVWDAGGASCNLIFVTFLFGVTNSNPADGFGNIAGVIVTGHAVGFDCAHPTG